MNVGDLVVNGLGHTGIVTAMGSTAAFNAYEDCPSLNPDIHVMTPTGFRLWSYKALKVISESR